MLNNLQEARSIREVRSQVKIRTGQYHFINNRMDHSRPDTVLVLQERSIKRDLLPEEDCSDVVFVARRWEMMIPHRSRGGCDERRTALASWNPLIFSPS